MGEFGIVECITSFDFWFGMGIVLVTTCSAYHIGYKRGHWRGHCQEKARIMQEIKEECEQLIAKEANQNFLLH